MTDGTGHQPHTARHPVGAPGVAGLAGRVAGRVSILTRARLAGGEDPGQRGEGGEAVHEGVVDLQNDRLAAPCEAVDQRHLPQGAAPVEMVLSQPRAQRVELAIAPGLGQDGMTDVACQIEGRVLHEDRVADPEGHRHDPPPECR